MAQLGRYNRLEILRTSPYGLFLDGGAYGEVLLPNAFVPKGIEPGEEIEVFLLRDSHDRVLASTQKPKAQAGEFAELRVKSVEKVGAFLDWGMDKDLLLPFGEQKARVSSGERVFVRVGVDPRTERLFATTKINRYLKESTAGYIDGGEVELQVINKTELGFNVIVDGRCHGLIFHNEVSRPLHRGQKLEGYIQERRKDGKLTISLQREGRERIEDGVAEVLASLEKGDGFLELNDKSDPNDIRRELGLSKKVFKRALGSLYRDRKIVIEDGGIRQV